MPGFQIEHFQQTGCLSQSAENIFRTGAFGAGLRALDRPKLALLEGIGVVISTFGPAKRGCKSAYLAGTYHL